LLAQDVTWEVEHQHEFVQIIDEEADKLTELVEQLLDLSRLHAGTMRIAPEQISLGLVLDTAAPQLQMFTTNHILQLDTSGEMPFVLVDAQRIVQVLSNLVHNAVKFSPPQSAIVIAVTQHDHVVQIDVKDHGIGIPQEERPKLFEAFRQVDRKSPNTKGAGLGLAICKGLIETHGGQIWIQDQPPPGTTISFTLPIVETLKR
jgi:two-component system sensor histidine kinase KdpD